MSMLTRAAFAAAGLALLAGQALAGTTVNVIESGEGGGAMSITVDKATIPAGNIVFKVSNNAVTETHEMVLVKLNSPNQKIPFVASKHRIDEKKLKTLGEVADLEPSANGELKAKLAPGNYMLLCNIKGHYEAGMATKLTVVAEAASN